MIKNDFVIASRDLLGWTFANLEIGDVFMLTDTRCWKEGAEETADITHPMMMTNGGTYVDLMTGTLYWLDDVEPTAAVRMFRTTFDMFEIRRN